MKGVKKDVWKHQTGPPPCNVPGAGGIKEIFPKVVIFTLRPKADEELEGDEGGTVF